jgi:AcrR family transcriptional regulator
MARPKGNYAATEQRRQEVLAAALEIFGENGFRGSSLRQVAEKVGMTEAGILHHFKTKGNLLRAVLDLRDQESEKFVPAHSESGIDFLVGWMRLLRQNIAHKGIVDLYATVSAEATSEDHPAHEYFKDRFAYVSNVVESAFAKLDEAGMLNPGVQAHSASRIFIAISDGLQIQWLMDSTVDMYALTVDSFRAIVTDECWQQVELQLAKRR